MHPIAHEIHYTLLSLQRKGNRVSFIWTPGHVGVAGNEKADKAMKEALGKLETDSTLVPVDDLKAALRNLIKNQWKEAWRSLHNNKLRATKSVVSAWPSSIRNIRREEVTARRWTIGHSALTPSYLFTEEEVQPHCNVCDLPLTVKHILTRCNKYQRAKDFFIVRGNLSNSSEDDPNSLKRISKYLRETVLVGQL
ncbi:uncharacterized protein [Hetaerina americana]|uniref:uncharacterized protein n=1 Tax=Hetaerina americana TaxID=62018 RepID=UPI003A7F30B9